MRGLIDGIDYAYLYDRFQAVSYLGPQQYGIVRRVVIEDEHLVNERRKAAGQELVPLAAIRLRRRICRPFEVDMGEGGDAPLVSL